MLFSADFVFMPCALLNNFWNEPYDVCFPLKISASIASREFLCMKIFIVSQLCFGKPCGNVPFGFFCLSCSHDQEYSFTYISEWYCFLKKQQVFWQFATSVHYIVQCATNLTSMSKHFTYITVVTTFMSHQNREILSIFTPRTQI
jgi:hypothetical protein